MPLNWNEIKSRAVAFSKEWAEESSEDAEAKSFWDGFFNVFGISRRRVATFETRVKKLDEKDGYIDMIWKGVVLVEHKSRGKDLDRAYSQATDYFPGLKEHELPQYIIVSDFEKFRLYDLDEGDQVEFPLKDLHKHVRRFGFIAGYQTRRFREEDPVNIKAAERMGKLHDALKDAGYKGHALELFLVRLLFCFFADDTGIFPRQAFHDFISQRTSEDGADLGLWLGQIFHVLNTPKASRLATLDEQLAEFPYVNGKLFEEPLPPASFNSAMREAILYASALDWSAISPAIFGSLFQSVMDKELRRNLGAHYTSEKNILKVIEPLFMDGLRSEFEAAKGNTKKLQALHKKMSELHFLDPACGCGNFLVIAYRELRQLELEILREIFRIQHSLLGGVSEHVMVDVDQFHGIEIEEFPGQIAQVAMWLMDHQMNLRVSEEFGEYFARLPLAKSANVRFGPEDGNALRVDWNDVVSREKLAFILGNPPFLGKKEQSKAQKADFSAVLQSAGIESGVLDFVAAWYVKATEYVKGTGIEVAFVSTNSITQGEQVAALWAWMLEQNLSINFAHRTFKWKNEAKGVAAVHCVIICFSPRARRKKLLFDYETPTSDPAAVEASNINPYLVAAPNYIVFSRSKPLWSSTKAIIKGSEATDKGHLILDDDSMTELVKQEPAAKKWIRPYLGGRDLLNGGSRWCLWLKGIEASELRRMSHVMELVKKVKQFREDSDKAATRKKANTPWLFGEDRQPTEGTMLLIPKVSSERRTYLPIAMATPETVVNNTLQFVPNATMYEFGVLQSTMHMAWMRAVAGRMKSDYQYSNKVVYNNFPWPDDPTEARRAAIADAAQGILDAREAFSHSTLADLYDPLTSPPELLKAHRQLDKAVDAAYGRRKFSTDADRVAFLFELYQKYTTLTPSKRKTRKRKLAKA